MLWIKAFHIIFMVTWFAGLFYLPRLFVYHCMSNEQASDERFCVMEHKLYYYIMTPGAVLTIALGSWLLSYYSLDRFLASHWLHVKFAFVVLLIIFHLYCGRLVKMFASKRNTHSEKFYRMLNEIPVIPLIVIVIMAVVRPF